MKKTTRLGIVFLILITAVVTAGCAGITSGSPKTGPAADMSVQITTTALPDGAVGVNYNAGLAAANGVPPYAWGIVSGRIPLGLSLQASTGQISGAPAQAGAFTFLAQVKDSSGQTASSNFNINTGTSSAPIVSADPPAYGRGFASTGLTLNGKAAINGTRLRLTDGGTSEAGSAFFNTPVNVQSFTNDFSFQLANARADGFTFAIQGNSPTILGPPGGGLGYGSSGPSGVPEIRKSVAVKFDLFNNAGEGADSTGLYFNGASPTIPAVDMTSSGVSLHSGHLMNVHMTYDGTTLVMQITDATTNATFRTSSRVNIPNTVGGDAAYVGFTGATGGLVAVQDILNWTYIPGSSSQVGSSLQITTSGLPGGAVDVNYNAALTAANGVPPYTWGAVGGQLPPGLSLQASTGQISGKPTQAGAFMFLAQVKDSSGQLAWRHLSINIGTSSVPIVSRVSPNSGPTAGGTLVTISGSNFQAGAMVLFHDVTASSATLNSATQIQAVTPPQMAGTVDVTVLNPDAQSSTLAGGFVYRTPVPTGAPTISGVSPNSGAPGTQVTITGANFAQGATVDFGSTKAASMVYLSATQLLASVPAIGTGTYSVTVTNPDSNSATLPGAFSVTALEKQSLLAGMTPSNLKVPAGWALATTQGFESGSLPPGQALNGGASITCTFSHSGTCSATSRIAFDSAADQWFFSEGQLTGREFYLSYYDYAEGMLHNEEYLLGHVIKHKLGPPNDIEELGFDFFNDPMGKYNSTTGQLVIGSQGNFIPNPDNHYGPLVQNYGSSGWNQIEIWFRANTPNALTGQTGGDGFVRIFRNGMLIYDQENVNWFGPVDMIHMQVEAGGWYTKNIWTMVGGGACAPSIGASGARETGTCNNFNGCACPPNPPIFNRYIDDIILLNKP